MKEDFDGKVLNTGAEYYNDMELKRKIVLLGDLAVGKTSLVRRFVYNQFSDEYIQTIGTKVSKKHLTVNMDAEKHELTLVIWDVLGQQGYTQVQSAAFRGSHGALFVCDITRKSTLYSILHYWIPKLEEVAGVPGVLLANKSDLPNWEIEMSDLEEFSKITGLPFLLTSAKTGENVEKAFSTLAELMLLFKPIPSGGETEKGLSDPKSLLDEIVRDFCQRYGNWNDAMAIIEANIRALGIDMSEPDPRKIRVLIDRIYRIEMYHLGMDKAMENKIKRLGILNRLTGE